MLPEVIKTVRTLLRPHQPGDVDDILEYASDPEWSQYLLALSSATYTRAAAESFIVGQRALSWEEHPSWGIEVAGVIVGGINLRFAHEHRIAELGYGLAPRLWGQGIVTEVARCVIGLAFRAYPQLIRVRARTDGRNSRSLRVMEKVGLRREALLRSDRLFRGQLVDEVVCGLLRDEWNGE